MNSPKILAVIPARGGSKGLPRKNVLPFCGKPLIAWTIECAIASGEFARVIVSTDDEEIAATAKAHGAEVPFLRPAELATDSASTLDVLKHALSACEADGDVFEAVCCLQPTSPLRSVEDIRAAIVLWTQDMEAAVYSVCEWEHPLAWSVSIDSSNALSMQQFERETDFRKGRQAHAKDYRLNGAFYLWPRECLLSLASGLPAKSQAWIMPPERSIDIDTQLDFDIAQAIAPSSGSQGPKASA